MGCNSHLRADTVNYINSSTLKNEGCSPIYVLISDGTIAHLKCSKNLRVNTPLISLENYDSDKPGVFNCACDIRSHILGDTELCAAQSGMYINCSGTYQQAIIIGIILYVEC